MKPLPIILIVLLIAGCATRAQEPDVPDAPVPEWPDKPIPTTSVLAHDPVMAREDGTYYVFTTGPGITVWASDDMETWMRRPAVFDPYPAWVPVAIPEFAGHMWAPDIHYHEGRYYLYYSVSAFGKNTSCIGVATNTTLNSNDPDYRWIDHGKIIQSYPGRDNWNAIDAQVLADQEGTAWMTFGSFWSGLKLIQLMPDRLNLAECREDMITIASRIDNHDAPPPPEGYSGRAGPGAIEAPFIFIKDGYYYLFASIDRCCRGAESTYKMIVGRSLRIEGPYVDRDGVPLLHGGGTIILTGDEDWYAVGHNSVYTFDGKDYVVFHGYDASTDEGLPRLRIHELAWDDEGWPVVLYDEGTTSPDSLCSSPCGGIFDLSSAAGTDKSLSLFQGLN